MTPLHVETRDEIFEIQFEEFQMEITGICNMHCIHCRGANEEQVDLPLEQIEKVGKFAVQHGADIQVIISGGEPLLHRNFNEVLHTIRAIGIERASLTTNGYYLNKEHINLISKLNFKKISICTSLDSIKKDEHDRFRVKSGAYDNAVRAIRLAVEAGIPGLEVSMRNTVLPDNVASMESVAEFAYGLGCDRINFSSVLPVGSAALHPDIIMNSDQKHLFIENVFAVEKKWRGRIQVMTSDPLKCLVRSELQDTGFNNELVLDGCVAGTITFNVGANGVMTPCPLVNVPIMNIADLTLDEMADRYVNSPVVKNLAALNFNKNKWGQTRYLCYASDKELCR